MMFRVVLEALVIANIAVALGLAVTLVLRRPVRKLVGARMAFGLWVIPVIVVIAVFLPGPFIPADITTSTLSNLDARVGSPALTPSPVAENLQASAIERVPEGRPGWRVSWVVVAFTVWLLGMLAVALLLAVRQRGFERGMAPLEAAPQLGPNIYHSARSDCGPCVIGLWPSRIVLPKNFNTRFKRDEQALILDHERYHQRAGHAQLNAFAAVVRAVFWINPVVHMAVRWFQLDQEMACDAAVLEQSDNQARRYGEVLLRAQNVGNLGPCQWSAAQGLQARLHALSEATPGRDRDRAGIGVLGLLVFAVATGGWAMRPESIAVSDAIVAPDMDIDGEVFQASQVVLVNVDAAVEIWAEPRSDIWIGRPDGSVLEARLDGDQLFLESPLQSPRGCEVSSQGQRIVLRVPDPMNVRIQGQIQANFHAPNGGVFRAQGCGRVHLATASAPLVLDLDGDLDFTADPISADIQIQTAGSPRIRLDRVDGFLTAVLDSGTELSAANFAGGGRFELNGRSSLETPLWQGPMLAILNGGSVLRVSQIDSPQSQIFLSGGAQSIIDDGLIEALISDLSARGHLEFGGHANNAEIASSSSNYAIIGQADQLDARGDTERIFVAGQPAPP